MRKGFTNDIDIELWARVGLIFVVLRVSARGSIYSEFVIGPKTSKKMKNRVEDAKRMIWGAGWGGPLSGGGPGVRPGTPPHPHPTAGARASFRVILFQRLQLKLRLFRFKDSNPAIQVHRLREGLHDSSHAMSANSSLYKEKHYIFTLTTESFTSGGGSYYLGGGTYQLH